MKLKLKMPALSLLLIVALAGAIFVPVVSAENVVPVDATINMKYFTDISDQLKSRSTESVPISEYSLVTVDPIAFMRDADNGKLLEYSLNGENYSIELSEVPSIIAPDAKLYIKTNDGTTVSDIPTIKQYQGRIVGTKSGDAFFTVDDNVILGRITMDDESYFISQSERQADGKIVHIVYNSKNEIEREILPNEDDIIPITISQEQLELSDNNEIENTISSKSVTTVSLLAVYDSQFHNAYPSSTSEITSMMSTVAEAFSPSYIGVNFQINAFSWDATLTSTDKDDLAEELVDSQSSYRDSTNSDLVSLFTGRDLDGNDIGNGGQFTNGVYEESAYSLTQMTDSGTSYTASSYQRPILITHELGHNFGAMHQTAPSSYSGAPFYIPSYARASTWTSWWTDYYSAMWAPFQTGTSMKNEFSSLDSGHGDSNHNNALRISQVKATVAGYQ
ncbi:M12 family metallo-peptidase [Methanolacinia petrolearia]|nr:M12 family metallo-peptidase [Methanolacinia petrolearia]